MRTINQQIKEAEYTFRLAGAGVQNYEKTIAGTEAKLSMLGQKLTQQQRAVEQYSRAMVAANDNSKISHYLFKLFLSFLCYTTYMISSSESVRPDIEISEGGYLS